MMSIKQYIGYLGVILLFGSSIILVIFIAHQDWLFGKWKAREKKWVVEGPKGFGSRLVKHSNPPKEFVEAFNNRLLKRFGWVTYLLFAGFILAAIAQALP